MSNRVVVVGGGWAGCAAAVAARRAGVDEVVVLERSDELLGAGIVGGIMRNNGRYTAAEEMIALGAGDLFEVCDEHSLHRDVEFPGHHHVVALQRQHDLSRSARGVARQRHRDLVDESGHRAHQIQRLDRRGGTRERRGRRRRRVRRRHGDGGWAELVHRPRQRLRDVCRPLPHLRPAVSLAGLAGVTERMGRKAETAHSAP